MELSDQTTSTIRTAAQAAGGAISTAVAIGARQKLGVDLVIPDEALAAVIFPLFTVGYMAAVNWLEVRVPWIGRLFVVASKPAYGVIQGSD